ncbi:MAG: 16S rRNA (guanine(966)-N(2))-methyltransferase RsmD [Gammaproteobacteria bacterium]|nr:16S rRNA (guanine(966)-N(2))-methyltransferase RsmD [Gammaproteobacteria bacterium]
MKHKQSSKRNSLRIIGGELRSRKIDFPDIEALRPTSDRIRETLFNWLQDCIRASECLDLFAGSGALGIEALSRGAQRTVFVESNHQAYAALQENLQRLKLDKGEAINAEAAQWQKNCGNTAQQFDIVFLDPPFFDDNIYEVCGWLDLCGCLKPKSKVYVESGLQLEDSDLPENWTRLKHKQAGQVYYYLFEVNTKS